MPHIVQASSVVIVYLLHFSLQTTTTFFCTFSLTLNFPNMKHLCFTQVIFDGEEEEEQKLNIVSSPKYTRNQIIFAYIQSWFKGIYLKSNLLLHI